MVGVRRLQDCSKTVARGAQEWQSCGNRGCRRDAAGGRSRGARAHRLSGPSEIAENFTGQYTGRAGRSHAEWVLELFFSLLFSTFHAEKYYYAKKYILFIIKFTSETCKFVNFKPVDLTWVYWTDAIISFRSWQFGLNGIPSAVIVWITKLSKNDHVQQKKQLCKCASFNMILVEFFTDLIV